jgi:hypothetical protein
MKRSQFSLAAISRRIFADPRFELIVFISIVLLNSAYLFFYRWIPSLDGPQHLYTANVLVELLRGNQVIRNFYEINDVIVGYWTAHGILAFFTWIFPAWVAEKLFIFILLTGVPLAFRFMVRTINPRVNYIILLIIPISQHSFFFMGYYAFSLAWFFFFLTIAFYFKSHPKWNIKNSLLFGVLLLLTFFTHMLIYGFTIFIIGLHIMFKALSGEEGRSFLQNVRTQLTGAGVIFLAALPSLVLAARYYVHVLSLTSNHANAGGDIKNLTGNLFWLSCLVGFNHVTEGFYNRILLFLLLLLVLFLIFVLIRGLVKGQGQLNAAITNAGYFWLIVTLIMLLFYFLLPDTHGTGSLSKRILLFLLFVLIAFLAVNIYPRYLQAMVGIFVIWYGIGMFQVRSDYFRKLDQNIGNLEQISSVMEENSVFIAVNAYPEWNNHHFPLYAGAEKPMVSLQNPQCEGQFPVVWNLDHMPPLFAGVYPTNRMEINWRSGGIEKNRIQFIDYIVIQGFIAFRDFPEYRGLKVKIEKYYKLSLVSHNKYWALYEIIPGDYMNKMIEDQELTDD